MREKIVAFAVASAMILSAVTPAMASHKHKRFRTDVNFSISQSGRFNQAAINSIVSMGAGAVSICNNQMQQIFGHHPF